MISLYNYVSHSLIPPTFYLIIVHAHSLINKNKSFDTSSYILSN